MTLYRLVAFLLFPYLIAAQTQIGGGSSGGVGSGASPIMGYYVSSACPVGNSGGCYNTPANTRTDTTCSWTNASTTVTCTDAPFASSDVGKQVMGSDTCGGDYPIASYAGSITSGTTVVTISTFTDSNHVILSATPANSSATVLGLTCFVWGNNDDAAMAAAETAAAAQAAYCPKIFLAAAQYMITKPGIFQMPQPPGCQSLPTIVTGPTYGNIDLPSGFEIEGRGPGATTVHIANNFPNGASKITNNSITSWFSIPTMGAWRAFQLTGDGQAGTCAGTTGGDNLIYMAVAQMDSITLTNFCAIPGNTTGNFYLTTGIYSDLLGQFNLVNLAGWGGIGINVAGTGATTNAYQLAVENSGTESVNLTGGGDYRWTFSCFSCYLTGASTYNQSQAANNTGVLNIGANTTARLVNSYIADCPQAGCNTTAGAPVLVNFAAAGGKLTMENSQTVLISTGTNPIGVLCNVGHTCQAYFHDSTINAGSANTTLTSTNAGDTFYDLGGNQFNNVGVLSIAPGAFTNNIVADGKSLTGSCTGVATASSTLGLYNTEMNPSNVTTTCTTTTIGAGKVMTQARSIILLKVSSTAAGVNASSGVVTVLVNGGATAMTCTIGTGTGCFQNAPVAVNAGDRISVQFTTQAADTLAGVKAFIWWQ